MDVGWVKLGSYASGLDADVARASLDEAEIPVIVRGAHAGVFGPGFQGNVPGGVELYVPRVELAHAQELLGIDEDEPAS